jgi:hypothetical protein
LFTDGRFELKAGENTNGRRNAQRAISVMTFVLGTAEAYEYLNVNPLRGCAPTPAPTIQS